MKRLVFNLATLLSLLIGLAVTALWRRSVYVTDGVARFAETSYSVQSSGHTVRFEAVYYPFLPFSRDVTWERLRQTRRIKPVPTIVPQMNSDRQVRLGPFVYEDSGRDFGYFRSGQLWLASPFRRVDVPHWFFVLLTAMLPTLWTFKRLRPARRRARGMCPRCGYDLRATPERCPECGGRMT